MLFRHPRAPFSLCIRRVFVSLCFFSPVCVCVFGLCLFRQDLHLCMYVRRYFSYNVCLPCLPQAAMGALSSLLMLKPADESLQAAWVSSVLPLAGDPEQTCQVQEAHTKVFCTVVLQNQRTSVLRNRPTSDDIYWCLSSVDGVWIVARSAKFRHIFLPSAYLWRKQRWLAKVFALSVLLS